jgi:hypothetical protein
MNFKQHDLILFHAIITPWSYKYSPQMQVLFFIFLALFAVKETGTGAIDIDGVKK